LFKRVLSIKRRLFGVEHIFTADSWINLGLTYYAMGKYKDAICCYQAARSIKERYPPSDRPNLPATYGLIGGAYFKMAQFGIAADDEISFRVVSPMAADYSYLRKTSQK